MSSVPKKADKLNLSLSLLPYRFSIQFSRILRKAEPVKSARDLDKKELEELQGDLAVSVSFRNSNLRSV